MEEKYRHDSYVNKVRECGLTVLAQDKEKWWALINIFIKFLFPPKVENTLTIVFIQDF